MEQPLIIRLEVEHMKHSMLTALSNHQANLDVYMRQAIEDVCKPENIRRVINNAMDAALKSAVHEEVEKFFRHGAGRRVVQDAVIRKLSENLDTTS